MNESSKPARAAVEKASGFAAQIRLERAKQAYPDSSAVQSLSVGKFRLVEAAVRADRSLSFEKAAEMSVEELSKVLYDCECYRLEVASREFAEAYAKAKPNFQTQGKLFSIPRTLLPIRLRSK